MEHLIPIILAGVTTISAVVVFSQSHKLKDAFRRISQLNRRLGRRAAVLDLLQDGVVLLDSRDQVLFANPAAAGLLGVDEVNSVATLISGYHEGETIRRAARGEPTAAAPAGHAFELTAAPTPDGGRFLVLRDQSATAEAGERRRDFVANASHEMQTPLAALIGMLDLLVDCDDRDERIQLLERCQNNALGLSEMTRDLLGLSRAEDSSWRPTPEVVELGQVCESVAVLLRKKSLAKGLELTVVATAVEMVVDRTALESALTNLVDNAISYTEEGSVELRADITAEGIARFEVEDSGVGISKDILPRIFERFFRGDPAHGRKQGGTGLGLSIVRNQVNRMGGRVSVSTIPGEGSTFTVELPLSPARPL